MREPREQRGKGKGNACHNTANVRRRSSNRMGKGERERERKMEGEREGEGEGERDRERALNPRAKILNLKS